MQYLETYGALGIGRGSNVKAVSPVAGVYVGGRCPFGSARPGRQNQRWEFILT